jgi:hypothetical protein
VGVRLLRRDPALVDEQLDVGVVRVIWTNSPSRSR